MDFRRDIFTKCTLLKRNILFWIVYVFDFYALAVCDNKVFFVIKNYELNVYRCIYQQAYIVFTCVFIIHLIFNERELTAIRDYKIIYTKSVQQEIRSNACAAIIVLASGFIFGQIIAMIINALLGGKVYIGLVLANMAIVSAQIVVAVLLIMGLRMIFIKDIAVYGIYYVFIFVSVLSENVYVSMPITIKIAGEEVGGYYNSFGNGYYVSFGKELWIGRLLLLLIAFLIYKIGVNRFCNRIGIMKNVKVS